ncbi:sensor histidine kinase [Paenibacillus xylaniclasticus]|uniref:sensor histidine kinase n=1 Tax=Paenibacillus xylaniclasticus TaxID=588083 RepID=UPI000FD7D20D|nr:MULTISPECIES: sensor histidine kinase [Paenibacillus]GFN33913.1 hypothetical protein PCURB6_41730 [Paenibacillus curdlanolyticus]
MFVLNRPRHWIDYLLLCLRILWGGTGIVNLFQTDVDGFYVWLGALGYTLSCIVPFLIHCIERVPRYLPVLADLLFTGGLFLLLFHYFDLTELGYTTFSFFQVPAFLIGYFSRGWHGCWTVVILNTYPFVLSGGVPDLTFNRLADEIFNLSILFGVGFCFQKIVSSYQKINHMYKVIQEQNKTLELYAKQIEKLTLLEERNRLSRDLHDTVGHTFTTTITGMDAVYYLIDIAPSEAKASLRELLHLTRNGLDEVRRHIHQIAPEKDEQSLSSALSQICNQFAHHTGTTVKLNTEGDEYPVSENLRIVFIRCLQESLTNAKKHGKATAVTIGLKFEENQVSLRIEDNGVGPKGGVTKGFGLQSMTDRLTNLNGSLELVPKDKSGMIIVCKVPILTKISGS